MNKYLLLLLSFCFFAHVSKAQNDADAKELYLNAEAAYFAGQWKESLSLLLEAENRLGRKTPKVHFLKVLVYEKLAVEDINELDPAQRTIREYLQMELPTAHGRNEILVRQFESTLPAQARAAHHARVQAQLLAEKLAWQEASAQRRIGLAVGMPGKDWIGTEFSFVIGSRSRMWVLGLSSMTGKNILLEDEFTVKIADKLAPKSDDQALKSTLMHIGYFQGIRVLPRERDFIKPFIGVRGIYHGEYSRSYHAASENGIQPDAETLRNIRNHKLDPSDFFEMKVNFRSGVSVDLVIGAMLHVKNTTLFTGLDVINSKRLQFGAAFKI